MKKYIILNISCLFLACAITQAQAILYTDSLTQYQQQYVANHKVVGKNDKAAMQFYPVNENYRVMASFRKTEKASWFKVPTSGKMIQTYREYGTLHFTIHDTTVVLHVYQSENLLQKAGYQNYLFIPFTDITNGDDTYEVGRYLDISIHDIVNEKCIIDFNKAYNPYCAYVSGVYNCPIPPRENNLTVAILAGEKKFTKH